MWRAILVDDEEYVRAELAALFPWERFDFCLAGEAENAQAAMDLIKRVEPDLVITDIRMPDTDGLELTAWIGQHYPQIIVALVSAYDDFSFVREALRLGAADYLIKAEATTETAGDFLKRISSLLKNRLIEKLGVHYPQSTGPITQPHGSQTIRKAMAFIQANFTRDLTLEEVASHVGVSKSYLSRVFPEYVGKHFCSYLQQLRIERAKELLRLTDDHIYEIASKVGFWNSRYFCKVFRDMVGMTPADYRRIVTD